MPDTEPLSPPDTELLARAAEGDDRAFEAFVTRHEAWLLRYARALGGAEQAEEILQDAFVGAWRGAASFSGGGQAGGDHGSAKPWLMAIARNAYRRTFRHRAGEPAVHESLDALDAVAFAAGWGSTRPDGEAERLATRDVFQRALDRLPPDEREVLVLRDLEGWTGDEAARSLGLSLAALKSRLHRARLHLLATIRELHHG